MLKTNAMTFQFSIINFPLLIGDVHRLPSYGIYISQSVLFARRTTDVSDFHSKNFQFTSNYWHRVTDITNCWKHLGSSLNHTWNCCLIWYYIDSRICFNRNHTPGVLRWFNLQNKESQSHSKFHVLQLENSQTTSTIWPGDHREDERFCAWSFCNLVQTVPEVLHSD